MCTIESNEVGQKLQNVGCQFSVNFIDSLLNTGSYIAIIIISTHVLCNRARRKNFSIEHGSRLSQKVDTYCLVPAYIFNRINSESVRFDDIGSVKCSGNRRERVKKKKKRNPPTLSNYNFHSRIFARSYGFTFLIVDSHTQV